jgi:hypothetical protein
MSGLHQRRQADKKAQGYWTGEDSTPNAYQEPLSQAKRLRFIPSPSKKTQVTASHQPAQLKYVVLGTGVPAQYGGVLPWRPWQS